MKMHTTHITLAAVALVVSGSVAVSVGTPSAAAYYPAGGYSNDPYMMQQDMRPETLRTYYGYPTLSTPVYRSQRDRTPTTPDVYDENNYVTIDDYTEAELMMFDQEVFEMFERIAIETEGRQYDNDSLDESQVDFQAIISNMCFDPIRAEIMECIETFGPYYNLRQSILSNELRDHLLAANPEIRVSLLALYDYVRAQVAMTADVETKSNLPDSIVTTGGNGDDDEETGEVLDLTYTERIRLNSQFVWEVCGQKHNSLRDIALCYERNQRLGTNPDRGLLIDAEEIEDHIR